MEAAALYSVWMAAGYLSGNVMYAYWIPKIFCHVDICEMSEDGNPGTANAFKYGGIMAGIAVIILELGKAFVPVFMALQHLNRFCWLFALVMASPVLGHAFPVFFRDKGGGKAIASSFGVLLALVPDNRAVLILAFYYILFSVVVVVYPHFYRSVITFLLFNLTCLFMINDKAEMFGCLIISVVVIVKHFAMYQGEKIHVIYFRKKERKIK